MTHQKCQWSDCSQSNLKQPPTLLMASVICCLEGMWCSCSWYLCQREAKTGPMSLGFQSSCCGSGLYKHTNVNNTSVIQVTCDKQVWEGVEWLQVQACQFISCQIQTKHHEHEHRQYFHDKSVKWGRNSVSGYAVSWLYWISIHTICEQIKCQ